MKKICNVNLMLLFISFSLLSCVGNAEIKEFSFKKKNVFPAQTSGAWNKNCLSCHGNINSTNKRGKSFDQIKAAIKSVPGMNYLAKLTDKELKDIEKSLNYLKGIKIPEVTKLCVDPNLVAETDAPYLTKKELANVIEDLFGSDTLDLVRPYLFDGGVSSSLEFSTFNDDVDEIFFKSHLQIINTILPNTGKYIAKNTSCIADNSITNKANLTTECLNEVVSTWGLKILRRPLLSTEQDFYVDVFNKLTEDDLENNLANLSKAILLNPEFLFRYETMGQEVGGKFSLTQYERAQRLSFSIWRTMPDEELFSAAKNGELTNPEKLEAQIKRMYASDKAHGVVLDFYKEWLHLNRFVPESYTDHFLQPNMSAASQMGLYQEAMEESERFLKHITFDSSGSFQDLFTSNWTDLSNLKSVANIYSANTTQKSLDPNQRSGILTRVATHMTGSNWQHPMSMGAYIRRNILCDELSDPPADFDVPEFSEGHDGVVLGTRKSFEKLTEAPNCIGCHTSINGLAFSLSNYDSVGRYQKVEKLYDVNGEYVTTVSVDAESDLKLHFGIKTVVNGGIELSQMISNTAKAKQCFAKKFVKYSLGRQLHTADGCSVDKMYESVEGNKSIASAVETLVGSSNFFYKKIKSK